MRSQAAALLLIVMGLVVLKLGGWFMEMNRAQRRSIMQQNSLAHAVNEAALVESTMSSHVLFSTYRGARQMYDKVNANITDLDVMVLQEINRLNLSTSKQFNKVLITREGESILVNASGAEILIKTPGLEYRKNVSITRKVPINVYGTLDAADKIRSYDFIVSLRQPVTCDKDLTTMANELCADFKNSLPQNSSVQGVIVVEDNKCTYRVETYVYFNCTSESVIPCKMLNKTGEWCNLVYHGTEESNNTYTAGTSSRQDVAQVSCNT